MKTQLKVIDLIGLIRQAFLDETLVKITFASYKGEVLNLKAVYVKLSEMKNSLYFSANHRYERRDEVKNYSLEQGIAYFESIIGVQQFRNVQLTLQDKTYNLYIGNQGEERIHLIPNKQTKEVVLSHDKQKKGIHLKNEQRYLRLLGVLSSDLNVLKKYQHKYKQIHKYIELLLVHLNQLKGKDKLQVYDMGSGKGYLTFALHDYLSTYVNANTATYGVEYREDLVVKCNEIAEQVAFPKLCFVQGAIEDTEVSEVDILIALHACDTATDDAIIKGIKGNAQLIVVAPCCHKQVRKQISKTHKKTSLSFITRHGTFLEQQSVMLTDSIRALILEYYGYKVKVCDFIESTHTPKNVMIVAEKKEGRSSDSEKEALLRRIDSAKEVYNLDTHYLEQVLPSR